MVRSQRKDDKLRRFEDLSLHHMNGLYGLALHLTRRTADAEDLVQETYLRAFEHFDQFRPGTNFRAWMFKILRNAFVNHYHRNKPGIHVDLESVEPTLGTRQEDDALNARIDTSDEVFRSAMSDLPQHARTMLILAYVEGFTYKEIAQVMSCPLGTVMSRLCRARRQLREQLRGWRDTPASKRLPSVAAPWASPAA